MVHTGSGLLGKTADVYGEGGKIPSDDNKAIQHTSQVLRVLVVDEGGEVTAIIEDHVEGLGVGESIQSLLNAPQILLLGLALPSEDGDASCGDAM